MSPIRPTSPHVLVEALAALKKTEGRRGRADADEVATTGRASLRDRLSAIVADAGGGPEADDVLRARIVRCVLAEQWGEDTEDDPLFIEAATSVERDLRTHPELDRLFRRAVAALAVPSRR